MLNRLRALAAVAGNWLLGCLFLVMLGMAVLQALGRQIGIGLFWGDELVRMAVLWVTMVGAVIAVGDGKHIRIDLVDRFLPVIAKSLVQFLVLAITAVICCIFAIYSLELIRWDYLDNTPGVGNVPAWVFETIIPISAFLMTLRFGISAYVAVVAAFKAVSAEHRAPNS